MKATFKVGNYSYDDTIQAGMVTLFFNGLPVATFDNIKEYDDLIIQLQRLRMPMVDEIALDKELTKYRPS